MATYNQQENKNWIGPYLSSAANLKPFGDFKIDENEVIRFKDLSVDDQFNYRFNKSNETILYNHNPVGYSYIIRLSTFIFPFLGDSTSLIVLQLLTHITLCLLLIFLCKNNKHFIFLFSILYVFNPLIIYFVVLNYYYFWQCIPGFTILFLLLYKRKPQWIAVIFTLLLTFATLSRPTILFLSIMTILLYYRYYSALFASLNLIIAALLFITINKPIEKNIWHTVYVGIAAYPNKHVLSLSDNEAYALYKTETGEDLNASVGGNYYDEEVISKYKEITRERVIAVLNTDPLIFIKNGILNSLQCFSTGYLNLGIPWLNIFSAGLGCIFLIALWISKQRFIILCITLYSISFCLYYPPIQAYLFGAYIILIYGFYNILVYYFPKFFMPQQLNNVENVPR